MRRSPRFQWLLAVPLVGIPALALGILLQGQPAEFEDVISREFTLEVDRYDGPEDVVGREFTLGVLTPNLEITAVALPSEGIAQQDFTLVWRVRNVGDRDTGVMNWVDRVRLGWLPGQVFDFPNPHPLAVGEAYDRAGTFELPAAPGTYQVTITTDGAEVVAEDPSEDDNQIGPVDLEVLPIARPDLRTSALTLSSPPGPSGYPSESVVAVTYEVTNQGAAATSALEWREGVYLVPDDGSGIPPASLAGHTPLLLLDNLTYLLPGGAYGQTVDLLLPTNISGDYFVALMADDGDGVLESDEDNNVAFSPLVTVELQPQPDLVVFDVADPPPLTWSTGTDMTIDWRLDNVGAGTALADAFVERVWLASNGDDDGTGLLRELLTTDPAPLVLGPTDDALVRAESILLPVDLTESTYWLKVETDFGDAVPELGAGGEQNNFDASPAINVVLSPTPDLVPAAIGPAPGQGAPQAAHPLLVELTVNNPEGEGWDLPLSWRDRVWLSVDEVIDGGDVPVGSFDESTVQQNGAWIVPETYAKTAAIWLPESIAPGMYHLILESDVDDDVFEFSGGGEANNVLASAPFAVELHPADLAMTASAQIGVDLHLPPSAGAPGELVELPWTVTNVAVDPEATTNVSFWWDTVYLSNDPDALTAPSLVGLRGRSMALAPGAEYAVLLNVPVPLVPPGDYWLHFVTDTFEYVFEGGATANNTVSGLPFTVTDYAANLRVESFDTSQFLHPGQPLAVSWEVANVGTGPPNYGYWFDSVYLSSDPGAPEPGAPGNIWLGTVGHYGGLDPGAAPYLVSQAFDVPLGLPDGMYWVFVVVDSSELVYESNESDNLGATLSQVQVDGPPLSDLAVEMVDGVDTVSGQPLAVSYEVHNVGPGATNSEAWTESFYLSQDQAVDFTDLYLGFHAHTSPLGPGEVRPGAVELDVPLAVSGSFVLLVQTNSNGAVVQVGPPENDLNYDPELLTITPADPVELSITSIELRDPDSGLPLPAVELGQPVDIAWSTLNSAGTTTAQGVWIDAFYLSADPTWSPDDAPIGRHRRAPDTIPPGDTSSLVESGSTTPFVIPPVLGAPSDLYWVIGVSDVLNQMPEADEVDNASASAAPVTARPIALELDGGPTAFELPDGESRWLVLRQAGGALPADRTVDVALDHPDHPGAWVELYAREGALPNLAEFDVSADDPAESQQELRVRRTGGGELYLMARAVSGVGTTMLDALVEAIDRPFAAEGVAPDRPGAGIVTLVFDGAQLWRATRAVVRPAGGGPDFVASTLHYDEASGTLLALFDLSAATPGTYDAELVDEPADPDLVSTLLGALEVEPPLPLALSLRLETTPSLRRGEVGSSKLVFGNTGNVNVPWALASLGLFQTVPGGATDDRVIVSSTQLGLPALESVGPDDALVVMLEDLGPSQSYELRLETAIGASWPREDVALSASGMPWSAGAFGPGLVDVLVESLRLAVLVDEGSNSALLAFAASNGGQDWRDAVAAALVPDLAPLHRPGDEARHARAFVQAIADAAFAGASPPLDPGNEVPLSAVVAVAAGASCAPFAGTGFDCAALFCESCPEAIDFDQVALLELPLEVPVAVARTETRDPDDPNQKNPPPGVSTMGFVNGDEPLEYRIHFENQAGAGAWASRVYITDDLQAPLRSSSVRLTGIQIGNTAVALPPNANNLSTTVEVAVTPEITTTALISAGVDARTDRVFWILQAIDPLTGEPLTGTENGLLPPAGVGPEGSEGGWVSFEVTAIEGTPTFTSVDNRATIQLDSAVSMHTAVVMNTIDADPPTSAMMQLPGTGDPNLIELVWEVLDEVPGGGGFGSGLKSYTISYSALPPGAAAGGPPAPRTIWLADTTITTATFAGEPGVSYEFFCESEDRVGNVESKSVPDVSVEVPPECLVTRHCVAALNSDGLGAEIDIQDGSSVSHAQNDLVLVVQGAVAQQVGYFLYGAQQAQIPFGDGFRCVTGSVQRLPQVGITGPGGTSLLRVDNTRPPMDAGPGQVVAGSTWSFQFWYRDPASSGAGFNLSDAIEIEFCD